MDVFKVLKRHPMVFPLACIAAAAMVLISEVSYWKSLAALDVVGAAEEARMRIHILQRSLLEAETSQRGYLLTSRKEYLLPYGKALEQINESVQLLDPYFSHEATLQERLMKLHSLIEGRLSELALTIRLHEEGRGDAALDILLSDIGKEQMDGILALSAELLDQATHHVADNRAE